MEFKYVTPYWRDSHEFFGDGISSHTGTYFFILNPNNERAYIKIFFYDLEGNEFTDMQIDQILLENHVLDFRIVDIIAFKDPSYRTTKNLRTGWLKIVCDVPLNSSGKIVAGDVNSTGVRVEDSWSIPFQRIKASTLNTSAPKPVRPRLLSDFQKYLKNKKRRS